MPSKGGRAAAAAPPAARRPSLRSLPVALVVALLAGVPVAAGCAATVAGKSPDDPTENPPDGRRSGVDGIWRPAPGTSWQIQFTGELDTSLDVDMYDVDLFDTPSARIDALHADGRRVVCYFSAGSLEAWRPDVGRFPEHVLGAPLADWPGERWLDIRALEVLGPLMEARLDLAVAKGCDGVEPDNVDAYANPSGLPLTGDEQLAYNRFLADAAHARGLSVGLKNDVEQVVALEPWFDWALNESCNVHDECALLSPFVAAGKAVFGIEYTGDPTVFCPHVNALDFDFLKKSRDLGPAREACR